MRGEIEVGTNEKKNKKKGGRGSKNGGKIEDESGNVLLCVALCRFAVLSAVDGSKSSLNIAV